MPRSDGRTTRVLLVPKRNPKTDGRLCGTKCPLKSQDGTCYLAAPRMSVLLRGSGDRWLRCAECFAAEKRWLQHNRWRKAAEAERPVRADG